jgi:hypothetical protein
MIFPKKMDCRVKPGNDEEMAEAPTHGFSACFPNSRLST